MIGAGSHCDDRVVDAVYSDPGLTATEISALLELGRRDTVHLLHEHFGECLFQDKIHLK